MLLLGFRETKVNGTVGSRADSHGNHQRVILHCIFYERVETEMRHPEWGTEFILTVRRATTGDILLQHNVAAMDLEFTWNLKLRLSDHMGTASPFELRILQGTAELDDSQRLRAYVQAGLLNVEIVMQTRRASTLTR